MSGFFMLYSCLLPFPEAYRNTDIQMQDRIDEPDEKEDHHDRDQAGGDDQDGQRVKGGEPVVEYAVINHSVKEAVSAHDFPARVLDYGENRNQREERKKAEARLRKEARMGQGEDECGEQQQNNLRAYSSEVASA